jgi:hypothetical protein
MPAPTVQMGLGGVWAAVAASHAPTAHVVCAMRSYRIYTGSWTTRLALSYPSTFASGYIGMRPVQGYAIVDCVDVHESSGLPGGGLGVALDGVDDYIEYTTTSGQGTNPASLELLVSYATAPGAGEQIFVAGDNDFGLAIHDDGRIYGYYGLSPVVDAALSTGTIHHVALVRSGAATDAITLYLNGVSVDTASIARATISGFFWRAGLNIAATSYHDCTIYGFAQHGTALTSGQVTASYNATQWTDVTADTKGVAPLVIERGIRDDGPASRVASTGTLSFSMNNLGSNSGGVTGYYSPGHASCRTGFAKGTPVRVLSGSDEIFRGRIRSIAPTPGKTGGNLTKVFATDYLDPAGVSLMENATVMESVRANEVMANVIGFVPESPNGAILFPGSEVYTLALDNTRDEAVSALSEMHRIAMSELGQVYVRRDGVLVFENRAARVATVPTASVTLADTMHGLDVAGVSSSSLNRVQVTVHPRVTDSAATTVLYELVNPLQIGAGETKVVIGPFRAATATGITTRVGGLSMVAPVATTDYTMNTASDDTGVVLTASLSVTAEYGPNGVRLTMTNNAVDAAYITKMQCRGKGVYDFRTIVLRSQDDGAIASDGVNALNIDMVYQEDPDVGQAMANLLLAGYGDLAGTRARTVSFYPDAAGMPAGLWTKDISDRVAVSETVTGATGEYYINGVKHEYQNGTLPRIAWWLSPAEPVSYWVLDTSTLGDTTMLGV